MVDQQTPAPGLHLSHPSSGNLVTILHTERRMKVYGVTENELRTLTAINLGIAVLFSIGSAMLGMALDLHKDILLVDPVPAKAAILVSHVQPGLWIGAAFFYVTGAVAMYLRGGFIKTIKKETVE
jgi:hypothetical protein